MKVYDSNLAGTSGAQTGRTLETQKTDRSASPQTGATGGANTGDRVEFSGTLGRLSQAMAAHDSSRASRVQSLAAQYRSGTYRPDSLATSKGMVSEAVSAGLK